MEYLLGRPYVGASNKLSSVEDKAHYEKPAANILMVDK